MSVALIIPFVWFVHHFAVQYNTEKTLSTKHNVQYNTEKNTFHKAQFTRTTSAWLFLTPLSHKRLVANAHELGTSQDSLETSQDGLGCVLARPCMSRQVTETEREIPFFSHRLVTAVDFISSREIKFSPPPATKMQLNCIGPSRFVPAS